MGEKAFVISFEFGSGCGQPYPDSYTVVFAGCEAEAKAKFRRKYKKCLDCAKIQTRNQWEENPGRRLYPEKPAEIIR